MIEYLLELALRKASYIKSIIKETSLEPLKELAQKYWISYEPVDEEPESFSAIDGSQNRIDFKGFTLYAVIGYGITVSNKSNEPCENVIADIDILYPPGIPERIPLYREIAETKTAYLSSILNDEEVELVMIDGSIWSLLIDPGPFRKATLEKVISDTVKFFGNERIFIDIWNRVSEELDKMITERNNKLITEPFISKRLISQYVSELTVKEKKNIVLLLEYLEKIMSIRKLLEVTINSRDYPRIVYISKTSRGTLYYEEYFKKEIDKLKTENEKYRNVRIPLPSDILVFAYFTKTTGYSRPIIYDKHERLKNFPSRHGLGKIIREFYDNISYAISYIRLIDNGPIFKIEIPLMNNQLSDKTVEGIIRRVMNLLKPLSVKGYPYPLIEADKYSKITRSDMKILASSIGLLPTLTGREVLVEWL